MKCLSSRPLWLAAALFIAAPIFGEQIVYHEVKVDGKGHLQSWASPDPAAAYDQVIRKVWAFWKGMKSCPNGVKYYLQHQVWANPYCDARGLGGDQLSMALSSWNLLYGYLGDRAIVGDMVLMADYWLDHGLSPTHADWPNLPFPYNMEVHSGVYDGDMRAGKGFLQPDKAASFGAELIDLYQITGRERYLNSAMAIADTLAGKAQPGDGEKSPWPFRVQAFTGEVSLPYTANWSGALRLFAGLVRLQKGNLAAYQATLDLLTQWMKKYPLQTNKWGPFFEDIPSYSETEINADTMAWYLLEHPDCDPLWLEKAHSILNWSSTLFANPAWEKYGVTAINEQTVYTVPGNSHTSRHASVQLIYAEKSGDTSRKAAAIRQLNWATYMVGDYGNNCYALDNVWLTDGYGDYVRHYLRAMAAAPELSPANQDHLLKSSSIIKGIEYQPQQIHYTAFDAKSTELLRIAFTPARVLAGGKELPRLSAPLDLQREQGYTFNAQGDVAGVLRIRHDHSGEVEIIGGASPFIWHVQNQTLTTLSGAPLEIDLSKGLGEANLEYVYSQPFHGKLSGTAPHLVYQPEPKFIGNDLITFSVRQEGQASASRQITMIVKLDLKSAAALAPPKIDYILENQYVAEGDTAVFGVRMASYGLHLYRWQRSRDEGKSWQEIPDSDGFFLAVKAASQAEFNNNLFRCKTSRLDGSGEIASKPMRLNVAPAGSGPFIYSRWMIGSKENWETHR